MITLNKFLLLWCLVIIIRLTASLVPEENHSKLRRRHVIGIDLGTSYSSMAVYRNGKVEVIPNDQGSLVTPSYVAFTDSGEILVGDLAKCQLTNNPENTVFNWMRLMGRRFSDPQVGGLHYYLPYKMKSVDGDSIDIEAQNKHFTPENITAMYLSKLKSMAEDYLGQPVSEAVVTLPSYFNHIQKEATREAGRMAGLKVIDIIQSPTAALLGYRFGKNWSTVSAHREKRIYLVLDVGGGTMSVSLISTINLFHQVLATSGNNNLGGEDIDHRLMVYFLKSSVKKTGVSIPADKQTLQQLRREVERAKRTLSYTDVTRVEIDSVDYSEILTRKIVDNLNVNYYGSILILIQKALNNSMITEINIDEVLLIGGSANIPKIQQIITDHFRSQRISHIVDSNPLAAKGAAIKGEMLSLEDADGETVNVPFVADICPLTLGVKTTDNKVTAIINSNSLIPTSEDSIFTTVWSYQESFSMKIYEKDEQMKNRFYYLGELLVSGIQQKPNGESKIRVTFHLDQYNILTVSGEELPFGQYNQTVIKPDRKSLFRLAPESDMELFIEDTVEENRTSSAEWVMRNQ